MNEERSRAQRVAHGVPITVLYVGHGEDEVPIADLAKTIKKLPKAIDKATMAAVIRPPDRPAPGARRRGQAQARKGQQHQNETTHGIPPHPGRPGSHQGKARG